MSSLHMTQKVNNVAGHLSIWNVSTEWPTAKKWAVFTHTVLKYTWWEFSFCLYLILAWILDAVSFLIYPLFPGGRPEAEK